MTVLDILETASLYLNKREELDYFFNDDNDTSPSTLAQKDFDNLLKSLNLIVLEIASEFVPIEKEEAISFVDNKANLSSLTKTVNRVLSVKNGNRKHKFKVFDGKISSNFSGVGVVKYSYIPETLESDDDIDFFDELISEKTIIFGVIMEYLYLNNLLDEVSTWEDRFYGSLKNNVRKLGPAYMPKRRWL